MHIEPDSACAICSARRQLEVHHIEPRRMGGSQRPEIEAAENKIVLCHACHQQITEQRWHIERTPERLLITDVSSGNPVARRLFSPAFQPSLYFSDLQQLEGGLEGLVRGIPYLGDDQLVEVFVTLRGFHKRSWMVQAAVLFEAKQRSSYGDRAWEAMGKSFGIGWRQAYNLARVWQVFFLGQEEEVCIRMQSSPLDEVSWYVACTESAAPGFWLAYAEDRKAEDPHYSVADLREEIRAAGAAEGDEGAGSGEGEGQERCRWLRVYCGKLGRVVSPGRCPGCDAGVPAVAEAAR